MTDEQQNQQIKEQRALMKEMTEAYQITFGSDEGQKVLNDLGRRCFANNTTYVPGDATASHVNEGTRSVYLFINQMINHKEK